jgi:hypothetical protein
MNHTPKEWASAAASAAFWLVVKLTLFRLAIAGVALVAFVAFIHDANSNAEWINQIFGTMKKR